MGRVECAVSPVQSVGEVRCVSVCFKQVLIWLIRHHAPCDLYKCAPGGGEAAGARALRDFYHSRESSPLFHVYLGEEVYHWLFLRVLKRTLPLSAPFSHVYLGELHHFSHVYLGELLPLFVSSVPVYLEMYHCSHGYLGELYHCLYHCSHVDKENCTTVCTTVPTCIRKAVPLSVPLLPRVLTRTVPLFPRVQSMLIRCDCDCWSILCSVYFRK
jgi:hypothetical protein